MLTPSNKTVLLPPQRKKRKDRKRKKGTEDDFKKDILERKIKATQVGTQKIVTPNLLPPHPNLSMSNMNKRISKTGKCQFPCQSETK